MEKNLVDYLIKDTVKDNSFNYYKIYQIMTIYITVK